jgi:Uma2 family endonuclease
MANPQHRRATYDDLRAVPDDRLAQIVDGELVTSPRPNLRHARAASVLGMDLGNPFERGRGGPGGWWILYEPEVHLHDDALVPDLAGWRRERMPQPPSGNFTTVAPDWICEVLSPQTARVDRIRKLPIYGREGVANAWLIDPGAQTLEVFRRVDQAWLLVATHEGTDRVRVEPFAEVELELGALWIDQDSGVES